MQPTFLEVNTGIRTPEAVRELKNAMSSFHNLNFFFIEVEIYFEVIHPSVYPSFSPSFEGPWLMPIPTLLRSLANSCKSNALNLNRYALRQLINCYTAPRWLMLKKSLINPVHLGKIIHGSQENIYLDNLFEGGASGGEDSREVLDTKLGHCGDV
jgi:hypothetical protein